VRDFALYAARTTVFLSNPSNRVPAAAQRALKIFRRLNSDKYYDFSRELREGSEDYQVTDAKMYENYLYVTVKDKSLSSKSGFRFLRISLDSGKEEILADEAIADFRFTGKKIIYRKSNSGLYSMDLNGKNQKELVNVEKNASFFCAGNSIYTQPSLQKYINKYDVNGENRKELSKDSYFSYYTLGTGLARISDNTLYWYDYDLNKIAEIKP